MDRDEYLASIRADADALADAAQVAGFDAAVPSCPGWDVARLVTHTGTTHRWVTAVVTRRATDFVDPRTIDLGLPADDAALVRWFGDGAQQLIASLATVDPDEELWSWGADHHMRFWPRRMAHETAVHRWDAQLAAGSTEAIDGDLAVDGIDECFDNLAFRRSGNALTGSGETIHLHCTDQPGEWLVRLSPGGVEVTREHAKGDVAARGTASDLELLLVGRVSPETVEVLGDELLLERWQEEAKF